MGSKTLWRGLAAMLLLVLPVVAMPVINVGKWMVGALEEPVLAAAALPPPSEHDRARRTAVVVTGSGGAEMTDFLIPYEVLARTGAFEMVVVAPERRLIPLASAAKRDGRIDLVPHYSLAEYDREIGEAPAVIVIPYLPAFGEAREAALVPWIRAQAERGSLVVSVCAGAEVLAATGLLDGGGATTHPSFLERLEARHPQVTWLRDVRYVENARTITSGAIASGLDATLAAVRRLLGEEAARRVAGELAYRHTRFLEDPRYATGTSMAAFVKGAFRPWSSSVGVVLEDGVSEMALGAIFDTYSMTTSYELTSVGRGDELVRSRHGLWLRARARMERLPPVERLLVPAGLSASGLEATGLEVTRLDAAAFAYDAALADIARRDGEAVARGVATNLNYPTEGVPLAPGGAVGLWLAPMALLAVGAAMSRVFWRRPSRARAVPGRA